MRYCVQHHAVAQTPTHARTHTCPPHGPRPLRRSHPPQSRPCLPAICPRPWGTCLVRRGHHVGEEPLAGLLRLDAPAPHTRHVPDPSPGPAPPSLAPVSLRVATRQVTSLFIGPHGPEPCPAAALRDTASQDPSLRPAVSAQGTGTARHALKAGSTAVSSCPWGWRGASNARPPTTRAHAEARTARLRQPLPNLKGAAGAPPASL